MQRAPGDPRQGGETDQSSLVPIMTGRDPDGRRVFTLYVPGIVPPGVGSIDGQSGGRNVSSARLSQVSNLGTVETAIRQRLEQLGVNTSDRVVLYGHSYGGIVARNVANSLARERIGAAFVTLGSPDGPVEPGVEAYMVQNPNDPVPATRIGGAGRVAGRYGPNQEVIQVHQRAPGALFDNHSARFYGENLTRTPNLNFEDFVRRQQLIRSTDQEMVSLQGPIAPSGRPNSGSEPYRLPPPPGSRSGQ
jgi:pimeloyl-ACP methyl ester carboxylesterase